MKYFLLLFCNLVMFVYSAEYVIPLAVTKHLTTPEVDPLYLEIEYRVNPDSDAIFIEMAERVWWIQDIPLLVLGSTGEPLPSAITARRLVFVTVRMDGKALGKPIEIHPRSNRVDLSQEESNLANTLLKTVGNVDATYLEQVSHYLAQNLATLDVKGTSYSVDGYGEVINSNAEWVGQPITGVSPWTYYFEDLVYSGGNVVIGEASGVGGLLEVRSTSNVSASGISVDLNASGSRGVRSSVHGDLSVGGEFRGAYAGLTGTGLDAALSYGVYGEGATAGIDGYSEEGTGINGYGNQGVTGTGHTYGVLGEVLGSTGNIQGVYGLTHSSTGYGVYGFADKTSGANTGVGGRTSSTTGRALYGFASSSSGINYALRASTNSSSGWAGYFVGNVKVTGTVTKTGFTKTAMDHPLDPSHKYLNHADVLSSELLNLYTGNTVLGAKGSAVVTLPEWFEALNSEIRYQLTCIGGQANVFISKKVRSNQFEISGGYQGLEVSWILTATRRQAQSTKKPFELEENKSIEEVGTYIEPGLYGQLGTLSLKSKLLESEAAEVGKHE